MILAVPSKLIFDDGTKDRGGKKKVALTNGSSLRAWTGSWKKNESAWRSTWSKGMGHTPVIGYDIPPLRDLIVEMTFRYGPIMEPSQHQCFRITLDNRDLYTGHVLSAWANPNNDFIEQGFLLQHISKQPDKTIISDLLLDHQPIAIEPEVWYTATLEVVGDETLFRMGDHLAYARSESLKVEKIKVALTLGTTWHEVKRVRVWEARPNPAWKKNKQTQLKHRTPFTPGVHDYQR